MRLDPHTPVEHPSAFSLSWDRVHTPDRPLTRLSDVACAYSNIESAQPTAPSTKSASRNARSSSSAKGRCAGAALVASRSGSTPRTPLRGRYLSARFGGSAQYHVDRGDGFTTGHPLSQFVKRQRPARRWSTPTAAREMRRTHANAVVTGSGTSRRWRSSTRFTSRLTCLRGSGCSVGGGIAKSLRRFGNHAVMSRSRRRNLEARHARVLLTVIICAS